MANQTPKLIKRKLAQSIHHLKTSGNILAEVHLLFDDDRHEPYLNLLNSILETHVIAIAFVREFWQHAYGTVPEDTDAYRG